MGCALFKKFENQETVTGDRRDFIADGNILRVGFKVIKMKHLFTIKEVSESQEFRF
jgi:hypothetical protein